MARGAFAGLRALPVCLWPGGRQFRSRELQLGASKTLCALIFKIPANSDVECAGGRRSPGAAERQVACWLACWLAGWLAGCSVQQTAGPMLARTPNPLIIRRQHNNKRARSGSVIRARGANLSLTRRSRAPFPFWRAQWAPAHFGPGAPSSFH